VLEVEGLLEFGVELCVPATPEGLELCATAKAARSEPTRNIPEKILFFLMKISIPITRRNLRIV
jgi:hypothetical protein